MNNIRTRAELLEAIRRYGRENEAEWNQFMDLLAESKDEDGDIILSIIVEELTRTHFELKNLERKVSKEISRD